MINGAISESPRNPTRANKFTMRNLAIEEYLEFTNQDHSEGRGP